MRNHGSGSLTWRTGAMCLIWLSMLLQDGYAQLGPPPNITVQPTDITVPIGRKAQFLVQVTPSITLLNYQWRFNGTNIAGASGLTLASKFTYLVNNAQPADSGFYSLQIGNAS